MIINHAYIGRGPVNPSDLFNILTWASIGATVNIYVAHPDKLLTAEQHTYGSLFNFERSIGPGMLMRYNGDILFSRYRIVDGRAQGLADRVRLISLPGILENHREAVPEPLTLSTLGWKTGILKFLTAAREWWHTAAALADMRSEEQARQKDRIMERLFSVIDATKFYLAATRQGLVCDMKVAPTSDFPNHVAAIDANFISFQRGNAGAAGFENQLSGSMCAVTALPRTEYARLGETTGNGFGAKTVDEAARYFEKITAAHGRAMQALVLKKLGVDSTRLPRARVVSDPQRGWAGPVCVFKHPTDQSWAGRTLSESQKTRAAQDINDMTRDALAMVRRLNAPPEIYNAMVDISTFPSFNIYA